MLRVYTKRKYVAIGNCTYMIVLHSQPLTSLADTLATPDLTHKIKWQDAHEISTDLGQSHVP